MAQVGTVDRYTGTLDALARIGREESKIAMEKQAKTDFAAGSIAITQGKALNDIQEEQPWYNKVFGPSATLRGAESQTAITAINQYFSDEANFLDTDEGRSLDPNAYRKRQTETLRGMLTGNSRVDAMITADVTPKLGALSETHMKAHRAYVNEQNVLAVSNRLLGEASNVGNLAASHGWSHDLTGEAKAVLGQSLANKPPGMDAESWRKMLAQSVVVNYAQGSDVMHRAAEEMGLQFTPQEQLSILAARSSWASGKDSDGNISEQLAWSKLAAGVDAGTIGPVELAQKLQEHQAAWGTQRDERALLRKAWGKFEEHRVQASDAQLYLTGRSGELLNASGNVDHKRVQPAIAEAHRQIEARHDMTTPEGRAAAKRDKIDIWAANGAVQDNSLKSKFTYISGTGVQNGSIRPRFSETVQEWMEYADVNEVKALDLISGEDNQANMQTVYDLVKEGAAADVDTAILMVNEMRQKQIDPSYLSSSDFNDDLGKAVENIAASKWSWFGFQTPQEASDNLPVISGWIKGRAKKHAARGLPVETAVKLATQQFTRTHDFINGVPVFNQGTPLATRMELRGGSVQEAVNFHMANLPQGGFEPDEFVIAGLEGPNLIVSVVDPDNADYADSYHTLNIREVGNNWNNGVVLPPLEGAVAQEVMKSTRDFVQQREAYKRYRQSLGLPEASTEQLNTELEDLMKSKNLQRQIIEEQSKRK